MKSITIKILNKYLQLSLIWSPVFDQVTRTSSVVTNTSSAVCPAVPAAVRFLVLAGRGTEDLRVTWSAAPGDIDHYEVQLLFNDMKVFPPITLGNGVGECVLSSLTPGRLYKILVSTFSGPNQRAQFIEGRTGQTPCEEEIVLV